MACASSSMRFDAAGSTPVSPPPVPGTEDDGAPAVPPPSTRGQSLLLLSARLCRRRRASSPALCPSSTINTLRAFRVLATSSERALRSLTGDLPRSREGRRRFAAGCPRPLGGDREAPSSACRLAHPPASGGERPLSSSFTPKATPPTPPPLLLTLLPRSRDWRHEDDPDARRIMPPTPFSSRSRAFHECRWDPVPPVLLLPPTPPTPPLLLCPWTPTLGTNADALRRSPSRCSCPSCRGRSSKNFSVVLRRSSLSIAIASLQVVGKRRCGKEKVQRAGGARGGGGVGCKYVPRCWLHATQQIQCTC